jgi:hypothetical protein
MTVRLAIELVALAFVVIVNALALWRSWARGDDHPPPADARDRERKTLSVDLRDRE